MRDRPPRERARDRRRAAAAYLSGCIAIAMAAFGAYAADARMYGATMVAALVGATAASLALTWLVKDVTDNT